MKTNWDEIFERHYEMYDPACEGNRIRLPGTTEEVIQNVERELGFVFPAEFHECYLAANGFGIDRLLLVPIERIPKFIADSRVLLQESHKDFADRFFPFIDNESGPVGYFLEEDGQLSPYMMLVLREGECEDLSFDPDGLMEPSAQSIWEYLVC